MLSIQANCKQALQKQIPSYIWVHVYISRRFTFNEIKLKVVFQSCLLKMSKSGHSSFAQSIFLGHIKRFTSCHRQKEKIFPK